MLYMDITTTVVKGILPKKFHLWKITVEINLLQIFYTKTCFWNNNAVSFK